MNNTRFYHKRVLSMALLLFLGMELLAKVIYVDASSSAVSPDGSSWQTAYADLAIALNAAEEKDDIWVAAGDYTAPEGAAFPIKQGVNLYGGFHALEAPIFELRDWENNETILNGNGSRVLFPVTFTVNTYFDGFTLTKGSDGKAPTSLNGGGAYLRAGSHLVNCRIHGNVSKNGAVNLDGGALVSDLLIPSLTNCIVENNTSLQGSVYYNSKGIIRDCILRHNNSTGDCGGAYMNVNCLLENTLIHNNEGVRGAAVFLRYGGTVENCIVRDNIANGDGGGIYFNGGGVVRNTIVQDNQARGNGGGIYAFYNTSSPDNRKVITNCTVIKNKGNSGGGIGAEATTEIENCVIANNEALNNGGGIWAQGASVINCTIVRNKAFFSNSSDQNNASKGLGGGIYLDGVLAGLTLKTPTILQNSIVWGNTIAKASIVEFSPFEQIRNGYVDGISATKGYRGRIDYCAIEGFKNVGVAAQVTGVRCEDLAVDNEVGPQFVSPSTIFGIGSESENNEELSRYVPLSSITKSVAFSAGSDNIHSYRIPSIVTANDGSLLVFCEARKSSWMDKSATHVAVKRSTDNGQTWSAMKLVVSQTGSNAFMDPCPVVDQTTGRVFLFATRWAKKDALVTTNKAFLSYSDDHGQTWSTPVDVTTQVVAPGRFISGFAPGSGFQMRHKNYAGRLIIPSRQYNGETSSSETRIIYSDDHGKTWLVGDGSTPTGELQVAEGKDGVLISNIRMGGARRVGYSYNGGISWGTVVKDPSLLAPSKGCQGSVLGNNDALFFSGPQGGTSGSGYDERQKLLLWRSLANGKTWGQYVSLYDKAAGYSCMSFLPDGRIALVFETADTKGFVTSSSRPAGWMRLDVLILPADISDPDCWFDANK